MAKLENGDKQTPAIDRNRLGGYLRSHLIGPVILPCAGFEVFMADRQRQLLGLIEPATGKAAYVEEVPEEGVDVGGDADMIEAEVVIPA